MARLESRNTQLRIERAKDETPSIWWNYLAAHASYVCKPWMLPQLVLCRSSSTQVTVPLLSAAPFGHNDSRGHVKKSLYHIREDVIDLSIQTREGSRKQLHIYFA
jgi:hypothetical protein